MVPGQRTAARLASAVSRLSRLTLLRGRSIRTYLVLLVLATLMPLLVFVSIVLAIRAQLDQRATEARLVDLARVLALAVDRDLRTAEAALYVLAGSPLLDSGDLRTFYRRATEIGSHHGGWIVMRDVRNQQVLNTARPFGSPLPLGAAPDTVALAVRTRTSYVSDVYVGAVVQRPVVTVGMPVVRGGEVRFVLDMGLLPERVAAVLEGPHLDRSWTVTVLDRNAVVVATWPAHREPGTSPGPGLVAAVREQGEGWARAAAGADRHFALARVPLAGWTVAIGVPVGVAYAEATRSLYPVVGGILAVLGLGVLLAAVLGRRIAAPLTALARAARRGDTEKDRRAGSAVVEIEDLERALHEAGIARRRAEREREQRATEEMRRATAEQALAAVAASEARWRALFQQSGEAVIIGDADGVCHEVNPAACRLLGYPRDELVGRPIAEIVAREDAARLGECLRSLVAGGSHLGEWTAVRRDGGRMAVEVSARALADGRWQVLVRDITERREIEQERARLLALERSARSEAEAVSRMKDEFFAALSHELRTPLNTIASWSRLLRAGSLDLTRTAQALEMIDRSVHALSILVRDLLDMNRIIHGSFALHVQRTDLSGVVGDACEALRPATEAAAVRLHCALEPGITAACDPDRVQQIIWNLLTNALKFTPAGGRVDVRLDRVDERHARLVVRDTGRGIPRDFLPRLFERFEQHEAAGPSRTRGLGIGLAIVKHLVERHGGTVTAESAGPGQGATFTVVVPLAGPPPPNTAPPA
jgi:PAS domain S-box-containing protein